MLHLPKGSYYRAHVLAVSDGQKGKDPVLTLRSGAFQGRAFLTDPTVDVPIASNLGSESLPIFRLQSVRRTATAKPRQPIYLGFESNAKERRAQRIITLHCKR